jgi:hypothetical protein
MSEQDVDTTLDMDLLMASLRADGGEIGAFLEALAVKLEEAVPGVVTVERRRAGLRGPKRVGRIAVDGGDRRLELRVVDGRPRATIGRVSGGITLKTEELDPDAWLRALGETLADQARRSQSTRQALERLLDL